MGDSSLVTWLSAVPLLVILVSVVAVFVAWRSRRRAVRTGAAGLLMVFGTVIILFGVGMPNSVVGGALVFVLGVLLLIVEYRPGSER